MADGSIRIETKLDNSALKQQIKELERELNNIRKEQAKVDAQADSANAKYSDERAFDAQFPEEFSHREDIDKRAAQELDPIIAKQEELNQKEQEYIARLAQANEKLQQQSVISQANKELDGAVKSSGALDKIQTEEQYQSMLAQTKAQMGRIEVLAGQIATKHGLSKEQLLATNREYQKQSDLLTQLEGKQGQFEKTSKKSMKSAEKSSKSFGQTIKDNIKQFGKMGLAIFGVRSAFMALRRAANSYLESNEKLKSQMDSLWRIAGQAIGPVIEWLIRGISTLVVWVDTLVQALFGISLVAKANAAALNQQASAAKKAASVAGFDEMNKLSDSGGGGGGTFDPSLAGNIPQWLEEIKQKILEGDWFGAGETLGQAIMDGIMNIDWINVGTKLGEIIGGILSFVLGFTVNIDPFQLVGSINGFTAGLFDSLAKSIQELDWVDIGEKMVKALLFGVLMADPATAILTIILSPNGDKVVSGASELIGSIIGALFSAIVGMGQEIGWLASELWATIKGYFDEYVDWEGTPGEIIQGLWNGIIDALKGAGEWIYNNIWVPFRDGFKKAFDINSPSKKMEDFGGNIIDGLKNGILNGISKIKQACTDIWTAIKEKFSNVGSWFKDKFSDAWQKVKDVFSKGGKIFDGIKEGISDTFKTVVNGLIGGINKVIKVPFDAINGMLNKIRGIEVAGITPFKNLWSYNPLSVPQIPKLALGGIVNRPGRGVPAIIGEAGAEAVLPLENNTEWMDILADKIGGNVTIPIYMDGKKIATYVVDIQKKKAFAMNGA